MLLPANGVYRDLRDCFPLAMIPVTPGNTLHIFLSHVCRVEESKVFSFATGTVFCSIRSNIINSLKFFDMSGICLQCLQNNILVGIL